LFNRPVMRSGSEQGSCQQVHRALVRAGEGAAVRRGTGAHSALIPRARWGIRAAHRRRRGLCRCGRSPSPPSSRLRFFGNDRNDPGAPAGAQGAAGSRGHAPVDRGERYCRGSRSFSARAGRSSVARPCRASSALGWRSGSNVLFFLSVLEARVGIGTAIAIGSAPVWVTLTRVAVKGQKPSPRRVLGTGHHDPRGVSSDPVRIEDGSSIGFAIVAAARSAMPPTRSPRAGS
jgi:hypothetical protein